MKKLIRRWLGIDFLAKDLDYRWNIVKESGLLDGKQNLAIKALNKRCDDLTKVDSNMLECMDILENKVDMNKCGCLNSDIIDV